MRQEFNKLKRLDEKWRRPRGIDSKRAVGQKSKGAVPAIGYGKTASVRGIHPSGYYPVIVRNPDELKTIKSEKEAAIISASVGRKKRNLIIKLANELRIAILNPKKGEL
ncbi:MAG: 50S ribosomal protein L32e [Acidobacteria bacterium]|nr:50S ribosomal protein L32e [Acidobacteriota bacterium]